VEEEEEEEIRCRRSIELKLDAEGPTQKCRQGRADEPYSDLTTFNAEDLK